MRNIRSISPYERYGKPRPAADAALRVHAFVITDTISSIAETYLGDWQLWRTIAERNQLNDVRSIAPGTELIIPRREIEKGRYESG